MKLNELLIELNLDTMPKSNEEIRQILYQIDKKNSKINFKNSSQISSDLISKFLELKIELKRNISILFPSLDAEKFINFIVSSPLKSNYLDLNDLIKLFAFFDKDSFYTYNYSDLEGYLVVRESPKAEKEINLEKYLLIFMTFFFPCIEMLISQYQNYQSNEQSNRIEKKIDHLIEQKNEYNENQKIIIEIQNDNSGGTRT